MTKNDKIYNLLCKHGYKGSRSMFDEMKKKLELQLKNEFMGTHVYTLDCHNQFFKFHDDYFKGCLFGLSVKQMIQALYNASYSNRILDRRIMKTAIYELESVLHAIDVYRYCGKTQAYKKLLSDTYHRQQDHLPQDRNLSAIKDVQCWTLLSMFKYFSIVAEYEAVRKATGIKDFGLMKKHRATIKYDLETVSYESIYNQYDTSEKHLEDDYIFMDFSIMFLQAQLVDSPVNLKCFDISRFRPTQKTIDVIIEKQIIPHKPFFDEERADPYTLAENHINGHYRYQVQDLYFEVMEYIKDIYDHEDLLNANKWATVK